MLIKIEKNSAPKPFKVKTELLINNNNNHKIIADQSRIDQLVLEKDLLYEKFQTENKENESLKQNNKNLLKEIKVLKDMYVKSSNRYNFIKIKRNK